MKTPPVSRASLQKRLGAGRSPSIGRRITLTGTFGGSADSDWSKSFAR